MAKIGDVEIISLLFDDQASAPTTPAAGFSRIFTKSDGAYVVDDAGGVTGPFAAASGATNLQSSVIKRVNIGSNLTTTTSTWADMDGTNLSISLTTGARRVMLTLSASLQPNAATRAAAFNFSVDGTAVVAEAAASHGLMAVNLVTSGVASGFSLTYITDALTAGAHTFKPRWNNRNNADTITALQSGANQQITFSAVELYA